MDNYAIFKWKKIKTDADMDFAYKHNVRKYQMDNADPSRYDDNFEIVRSSISYMSQYEKSLTDLKVMGKELRTIRKDAVKGLEVILTFSKERAGDIDIREWAEENYKWLDKNFNPPDHEISYIDKSSGKERKEKVQNIKHAIVHMDESKPHMHAFIVPLDDKGNLNFSYYDTGRQGLIERQTDYAKAMEKFGLERGARGSVATTVQMDKYYSNITKSVEAKLPAPQKGEPISSYKARADKVYQATLCNHNHEKVKGNQKAVEMIAKERQKTENLRKENNLLKEVLQGVERERGPITSSNKDKIKEEIEKEMAFKKAMKDFPDPIKRNEAERLFEELSSWQRKKDKEKLAVR